MVYTFTQVYIFLHNYIGIFKKKKKENSFNDAAINKIIILYQKYIDGITLEISGNYSLYPTHHGLINSLAHSTEFLMLCFEEIRKN